MKLKTKIVKKAWGHEEWIWNEDYCGKLLVLKEGYQCSMHYHKVKDEVFYVIRGRVLMEKGNEKAILEPGDAVHISPGELHRFTGLTSAQIIEFSSHHSDEDSYRKSTSGKANLKKGYDYDGVVSNGIIPEPGAPIITSRSYEEIEKIPEILRTKHPIYFNPCPIIEKNLETEVRWKAFMIKRLKLDVFYEDKPEVIIKLQKLCLGCDIRKV